MKNKIEKFQNYFKFILFILGFVIIILSELGYKFIYKSICIEFLSITLPIIFIIMFYFFILIQSKFKFSNL